MSQQVKIYRVLEFFNRGSKVSYKYTDVDVSSAELLALYTTPKTLVTASGAKEVLELISLLIAYDAGTIAYTIGTATNLQVNYTNATGAAASSTQAVTGFIDQATDQVRLAEKVGAGITPVVNAALVLTLATANVTAGNGTLHVRVMYRILQTGL